MHIDEGLGEENPVVLLVESGCLRYVLVPSLFARALDGGAVPAVDVDERPSMLE